MTNNIDKIIAALTKEKENNEKNLNASEYNDFYLGYREALVFALNACKAKANAGVAGTASKIIDLDDIKGILDREG